MGVEVRLVLYARDEVSARAGARAAYDRVARLEQMMSDYRPQSEVRRLERRVGEPVTVSAELVAVLAAAIRVAERSRGAFDPTVGPLVSLWREARRVKRLPDQRALDSARALVDWRAIVVDEKRGQVTLMRPGMRLDLGGVAKGYILQAALEQLREEGIASALLEAGGDIAVSAAPPGRAGWTVDAPFADSATAARALSLSNACVAASGPSAQFLEIAGVRYSHVMDPRTGMALTTQSHATVIATDCAVADALATALTVLEPESREVVIEAYRGTVLQWSVGRPRAVIAPR
jgi:FAD:protein FMN transferase